MSAVKAMAAARKFAMAELGLRADVVAAVPTGEGWRITLEAVVEAEYMRQRAQRDLVATYEVTLDGRFAVSAFERKELRERGATT
ncbi:MAG TPA: gas vesicle protein GvpO [Symbiobacteriaceae bacterium]|nr:gas vesicle protein GvpO [Symbiobacteriaceae bacterium]